MTAALALAAHVGSFVAAAYLDEGLLAIVLAAGARGDHRINVLDPGNAFAKVASFATPSASSSGLSRIMADGDRLISADDHTLTAFDPKTGARLWRRKFPKTTRLRPRGTANGRILVVLELPEYNLETRVLSTSDGRDEAKLPGIALSLGAPCLGPNGEVFVGWIRTFDIFRLGQEKKTIGYASRKQGITQAIAYDDGGKRLLLGTDNGEVLLFDLATETMKSVLELPKSIRSLGFHEGAPWVLDAESRFRRLSANGESIEHEVDFGLTVHGGILASDARTMALADMKTRSLRVRSLPQNEELFATTPGFTCESVAFTAKGSLLVADDKGVLEIDPEEGTTARLGGARSASRIERLGDGTLLFCGSSVQVLGPGDAKPVTLAKSAEEVVVSKDGRTLVTTAGMVVEVWDLGTRTRTNKVDLGKTWVGETGEALRFAHVGPKGAVWVHLTDGQVHRLDGIDDPEGDSHVYTLPKEGVLCAHPTEDALLVVRDRHITRLDLRTWKEGAPLALPLDTAISALHSSPSGSRLALFHRNGRLSTFDLPRGRGVAVDAPETSAAERAPNELFIIDLMTPASCAFTKDEETIAWIAAGGITFADVTSGKLKGRLLVPPSGREHVVTDGVSFDWSAKGKKGISADLVATENGSPLDHAALLGRRKAGLLRAILG